MNNDDAARAKALANEIWSVDWNAAPIETWTPILAAALDEARRDTWEAAAQMVEDDCYAEAAPVVLGLTDEENFHNANQLMLAKKIRQQAQRLTPSQSQDMSRSGEEEAS